MSEVKVNKISPRSGTAITLGDSGDTFTIPSGATLAIAGSVTGFTSAGIDDNATSVAITIDSSERVGIGTTSPANTLDVNDSAGAVIKITRDSQSSYLQLSTDGSSGQVFSGAGDLKFKTGSSEAARIDTSGNFGIGVSSPSRKLQVVQDSTSAGGIYLYSNAVHTGTGTNALLAVRSDSNNGSNNGDVVNIQGDGVGDLLVLNNNGTDRVTVQADGKIGIGLTNPAENLQVNDTASNKPQIRIETSDGGNKRLDLYVDGSIGTIASDQSAQSLAFRTSGGERMRITSAGLVGIGTSSPSEELEVSGAQNTITKSKTTTSTALGGFEAHGSASSYIKVFQHGPSFGGTTFGGVSGNDQSLIEAQAASSVVFSTQGNAGGSNPDFIFAPQRSAKFIIKNSGNVVVGNSVPSGASSSSYKQLFVNTGGALSDSGGSGPATQLLNNSYVGSGNNNFATVTQKAARILMTSGRIDFATAASVSADAQQTFTDRMRVNDNGVVSVPSGLALGVGTATTASNVLSDYEEGTFTPTFKINNSTAGISATQVGAYTKIGNLVTLQIFIELSNKGSSTGFATISGIPFTIATLTSSWSGVGTGPMVWNNMASALVQAGVVVNRSSQILTLIGHTASSGSATAQQLNNNNFNNNSYMGITVSYLST